MRALATSLIFILLTAFVLRAAYGWSYVQERPRLAVAHLPFQFEPGNIATSLAEGNGFSSPFGGQTGPTAWMPPVYPLILAGIFRIFGVRTFGAFVAAAGLNIVLSTLTVVPIYFVGRRVAGIRVAALAGWLWAVFPNAIKLPVESLWDASLAAFLAAAILWATLALAGSETPAQWYAYGLLWGLALMTTPALGSLLPFLLAWLAWRSHRVTGPLLTLAAAILCCVPWTVRNFSVFHSFIPLRSVVGLTLWLGNHDQSGAVWVGRLHPIDNAAERARYTELGEIEYMREKKDAALDFIGHHPGSEIRAIWSHFVPIWTGGSMRPIGDFVHSGSWTLRGILLFNILAGIGAFAGVAVLFRSHSVYAWPLAVFPIVFPLVYYVTLGSARYRHPMDPVLLLLTSIALGGGMQG